MNRLRKEINRLLSKGMTNIYLKVTIQTFVKLQIFWVYKTCDQDSFGELQITQMSSNFVQLKNQTSGSKTVCGFSIILILKGVSTC